MKKKFFFLVTFIFLISLLTVSADEIFLQNETTENLEDTFIDEGNPDLDNGNDSQMLIGEIADEQQSFIKFSISQIPLGSEITKAELGLFEIVDNTENADTYDIYEVDNQTWNENEVTFNNQPLIRNLIVEVSNPTVGSPDGFILFDVLSWVLNQSSEGLTNVSFNINKSIDGGGGNDQVRFQTKELIDQTQRPFLNITFTAPLNSTNLNVFLSKNPIEILEEFTLFANYTNSSDSTPVLNAVCFANSSIADGGGSAGFGRGILGIGELSTLNNAVHTQVNDIFNNNTLRVDIDNIPTGKASYGVNFRFHAHNQTPIDNLRVFATCHPNNLSFSNFTLIGQVNTTEAVISTSEENDTIWGFKNVVLFGASVASPNCSIVFESLNTTPDKHWMIADTIETSNLNNSFTSNDFGETYVLRTNANERSPFVDAGFGLDVPNETTMQFNSTSGFYFLPNVRHGRPFDFEDRVFCSADNFQNATNFIVTNVEDNVNPIVQIISIIPTVAVINISNVTIEWSANDPELLVNFINVSFPNGSLVIQTENKPLILIPSQLTTLGNYSVVAFANDTGGLFTLDNGTFEVADIDVTPPVIILTFNINNTINNTIPFNVSFSVTDNFPNNIICNLQNSTTLFDSGTFIQSANSNLTLAEGEIALNQNFPNLELTCFDNTLFNNSATLLLNLTLDTIPPVIIIINPNDNQAFSKVNNDINILVNCTDVPVFRLNITISNSSDRIASFESRSSVNNVITIDEQLTISDLATGTYELNATCADPHTKELIADYTIRKNLTGFGIKYNSFFEIKYLEDSLDVIDFGTEKVETNDKYNFWFNTNETESKTERAFTFEIRSKSPVYYLSDSTYKAHFVTGNNWIDFNLIDDKDASYFIERNSDGNYQIEVTTTKTNLNFNSVGDLNVISEIISFKIVSPPSEFFKLNECKFDNITNVFIFAFLLILGIIVIVVGWMINSSMVSTFGALMFLFMGIFTYGCSQIIAILIIFTSLAMIIVFLTQGASGRFGIGKREDTL